jgi:hypothetical protein
VEKRCLQRPPYAGFFISKPLLRPRQQFRPLIEHQNDYQRLIISLAENKALSPKIQVKTCVFQLSAHSKGLSSKKRRKCALQRTYSRTNHEIPMKSAPPLRIMLDSAQPPTAPAEGARLDPEPGRPRPRTGQASPSSIKCVCACACYLSGAERDPESSHLGNASNRWQRFRTTRTHHSGSIASS